MKINNYQSIKTSEYLELLKKCLTRLAFDDNFDKINSPSFPISLVQTTLKSFGLQLVKEKPFNKTLRMEGKDWPKTAETMIGMYRLNNIQECMFDTLNRKIPGDFIEAGVWRGGATILMRAVLKQFGVKNKIVWVADSFKGLPKPDPKRHILDKDDTHWKLDPLAISLEEVRVNFEKYNLLDNQVKFLAGWFKDTLPKAPIKRLALLRIDGDMYGSTMDALVSLYPKLSPGGYVIIDDYGALPNCKTAVNDFRIKMGIKDKIHKVDWTGIFWQRSR